ncbi:MAG: hypothetical protein KUG56_03445 [Kordiimonadaceae bacterium]|nr:hypothetical protein [Kordiimonadaceae bacterium]
MIPVPSNTRIWLAAGVCAPGDIHLPKLYMPLIDVCLMQAPHPLCEVSLNYGAELW